MGDEILKLYTNQGRNISPHVVMFDKKYLAGWTLEEDKYYKWMLIYTSFGQVYGLHYILKEDSYVFKEEEKIQKDIADAYIHNMKVLEGK